MNAKIKGHTSIDQDLKELDSILMQTHGPNQYIIAAMKVEVKAMNRLENTIQQNIQESKKIVEAVRSFEVSTKNTEKIMIVLACASLIASLVQVFLTFPKSG